MSKVVDSFYTLYNNPFLLSSIVVEFYRSYDSRQKNDILLSYLVLPIALYECSKSGLQRANKQRSIRSFVKEEERLFGLSDRIKEYKKLTNMAIQFAIDQNYLFIDKSLSVSVHENSTPQHIISLKQYLTAAGNLARMLKGIEIASVYRQFGIKNL